MPVTCRLHSFQKKHERKIGSPIFMIFELALKNALRYFPSNLHPELAPEFYNELKTYGVHIISYKACS